MKTQISKFTYFLNRQKYQLNQVVYSENQPQEFVYII